MSLSNFVTERLKITSNTKSANILIPTTKDELIDIINQELDKQGRDANLNHIDTYKITDMSFLFKDYDIRRIEIDEWDTSNVTDMMYMFSNNYEFKCDLSHWDVGKVKDMRLMFDRCDDFESDLSGWDVSLLDKWDNMFYQCPKMLNNKSLQPKFIV